MTRRIKKAGLAPAVFCESPASSPGGALRLRPGLQNYFFLAFFAFFAFFAVFFFAFLAIASSSGLMDGTRHRGLLGEG
jgi:hypothetical protein